MLYSIGFRYVAHFLRLRHHSNDLVSLCYVHATQRSTAI